LGWNYLNDASVTAIIDGVPMEILKRVKIVLIGNSVGQGLRDRLGFGVGEGEGEGDGQWRSKGKEVRGRVEVEEGNVFMDYKSKTLKDNLGKCHFGGVGLGGVGKNPRISELEML
jgi:hypothetical protein